MSSVIVMRAWPSAADLGWVEPEVDDQVAGEGVPGRGSEAAASRCRSARRAGRCARARVVENLPPPLRRGGLLSRAGSRVARPFAPVHALVTPRAASPPVVAPPRLSPESARSVVGRLSNAVGPRAVLRAGRAAAAGEVAAGAARSDPLLRRFD